MTLDEKILKLAGWTFQKKCYDTDKDGAILYVYQDMWISPDSCKHSAAR